MKLSKTTFFLRFYRGFLILALLVSLGWLVYKNTVVSGKMVLVKDFCNEFQFISDLYPEVRVGAPEIGENLINQSPCFQRIFIEPVYFKANVSRTFSSVKVNIYFQNTTDLPLLQLGIMLRKKDPLDWRFKLEPLQNRIFDNLDWFTIYENGVVLFQKKKEFNSINEFVNNLPMDNKTVTFNYEFAVEAIEDSTKVVPWNPETPLEYVDYIIAKYQPPQDMGNDWYFQSVEFPAGFGYMNERFLHFIVSAPGLTESRQQIKVGKLEIEFFRPLTTWDSFIGDLKKFMIEKLSTFKKY